ncbi:phosphatase PAP2 family protein [Runella sp.]|uniref:phosphatase PAP2 family protein n=1 Tax=Runella sp. TaxID=1960881 RepID=UPI003D0ED01A
MKKYLLFLCLFSWKLSAQDLDTRLLQNVYGSIQPTNVNTEKFLSSTAKPLSLALPAGLLIVGFSTKDKKLQQQGWQALGGFLIGTGITQATKRIVLRDRPFIEHPTLFAARIEGEEPHYSFPSGHTTVAFSTATTLAINYRKWYVIVPAYAWAGAVGYSRMRLGVHYPSDILAGAVTGAASAWLSYKIQQKWLDRKKRKSPN